MGRVDMFGWIRDIGLRENTNTTLGMGMGHTIIAHLGIRVVAGRQGIFRPSDNHHHLST